MPLRTVRQPRVSGQGELHGPWQGLGWISFPLTKMAPLFLLDNIVEILTATGVTDGQTGFSIWQNMYDPQMNTTNRYQPSRPPPIQTAPLATPAPTTPPPTSTTRPCPCPPSLFPPVYHAHPTPLHTTPPVNTTPISRPHSPPVLSQIQAYNHTINSIPFNHPPPSFHPTLPRSLHTKMTLYLPQLPPPTVPIVIPIADPPLPTRIPQTNSYVILFRKEKLYMLLTPGSPRSLHKPHNSHANPMFAQN